MSRKKILYKTGEILTAFVSFGIGICSGHFGYKILITYIVGAIVGAFLVKLIEYYKKGI